MSLIGTRYDDLAYEDEASPMPDPPLKNPYMEGIEAIEGILTRLQNFTKEYPKALDSELVQDYTANMLKVRDTLHRFRQTEVSQG